MACAIATYSLEEGYRFHYYFMFSCIPKELVRILNRSGHTLDLEAITMTPSTRGWLMGVKGNPKQFYLYFMGEQGWSLYEVPVPFVTHSLLDRSN